MFTVLKLQYLWISYRHIHKINSSVFFYISPLIEIDCQCSNIFIFLKDII